MQIGLRIGPQNAFTPVRPRLRKRQVMSRVRAG
jgi:hypothetical protein